MCWGEVCGNCVAARGRLYYSWKSVGCKDALFATAFSSLFPIQWCFGEAIVKDKTWQLCANIRQLPFWKVLLQLSCRGLCPVYPQSRDDSAERVWTKKTSPMSWPKRAVHACSSKAEIVLYCETRRDKKYFLALGFFQLPLILEHVFYFCYLLHIKHTKLPDLIWKLITVGLSIFACLMEYNTCTPQDWIRW